MRLLSCLLLAAAALAVSGCCGPNECSLPEGSNCSGDYQCDGTMKCFGGQCRLPCNPSTTTCATGQSCVTDTSATTTNGAAQPSACVPFPGDTELWYLHVISVANATGGVSEIGAPEPFVCLVIDQTTLCTEEEEGVNVTFNRVFTTSFPTTSLSNVSATTFESDDIGTFSGCEGSCPELAGWTKEVLDGQSFDGRPVWSLHRQPWTLLGPNNLVVNLEVVPAQ